MSTNTTATNPSVIQVTTSELTTVPPPTHPAVGAAPSVAKSQALGIGTEGEKSIWIGRYSYRNFFGRIFLRVLVTVALIAGYVYFLDPAAEGNTGRVLLYIGGGVLTFLWLSLFWQMFRARYGHKYELTNRRLFISTGVFRRRRDQVELLRVQDIFIKQPGLFYRMANIGTVVVETSEELLPVSYIAGVNSPKAVMDLIWHHARTERDLRSVKVDQV